MNFEPGIDDPFELCNEDAYRSTGFFTETMIESMFFGAGPQDDEVSESVPRSIGMILVRPDMTHIKSEFESFLRNRFKILAIENVVMDTATYWQIYRHDLYRTETMHSRLSRAALYIGSRCSLMVFQSLNPDLDIAIPDYARDTLRGNQGVYKPGTLRGEIVYRNALALGLHQLADPNIDERIRLAADPFNAYQSLANRPTGPHATLEHPLLFYTGVGVHVPNLSEIHSDLPALQPNLAEVLTGFQPGSSEATKRS